MYCWRLGICLQMHNSRPEKKWMGWLCFPFPAFQISCKCYRRIYLVRKLVSLIFRIMKFWISVITVYLIVSFKTFFEVSRKHAYKLLTSTFHWTFFSSLYLQTFFYCMTFEVSWGFLEQTKVVYMCSFYFSWLLNHVIYLKLRRK